MTYLCVLCGLPMSMQCSDCSAPYCSSCGAFYCVDPLCIGYATQSKKTGLTRREVAVYLVGLAGLTVMATQNHVSLGTSQSSPSYPTRKAISSSSPAVIEHSIQSSNYVALARACALENHLNPDCFVRQINQESGFNPAAVSPAGAIGIAQFMPSTAASLGINPHDPVQSLHGAAHLMASYVAYYDGSYAAALAAYNAGSGAVNYAIERGGANWQAWLPSETQRYIIAILG